MTTVVLGKDTKNGTTTLTNDITASFSNSSDVHTNYEKIEHTFEAASGSTLTLVFNSFTMDHSLNTMSDALGILISNDNITYTSIASQSIDWLQDNVGDDLSSNMVGSYSGSSQFSSRSKNGFIVPQNRSIAAVLDPTNAPDNDDPIIIVTPYKFIKFQFQAKLGNAYSAVWDIDVKSVPGPSFKSTGPSFKCTGTGTFTVTNGSLTCGV